MIDTLTRSLPPRRRNRMLPSDPTVTATNRTLSSNASRIITPAVAVPSATPSDPTRATTSPSTVKERETTKDGSGTGDRWRVIVLNDDHNTFEGVAAKLSAVLPDVTFEHGMRLATKIHYRGLAIVWSGHRELAEHYWQLLADNGLTMAPLEH